MEEEVIYLMAHRNQEGDRQDTAKDILSTDSVPPPSCSRLYPWDDPFTHLSVKTPSQVHPETCFRNAMYSPIQVAIKINQHIWCPWEINEATTSPQILRY